jgi:S1-C subfamily serine protease
MPYDAWGRPDPSKRLWTAVTLAVLACVVALVLSTVTLMRQQGILDEERAARRNDVANLRHDLNALRGMDSTLKGRLDSAETKLALRDKGIAPLAERALRSVFTVRTDYGLGSGFFAWRKDESSYVVTAYHVVEKQKWGGVSLSRKDGSWAGEIESIDPKHDLALIRLDGHPRGAAPLWQKPVRTPPRTGDQLVLIGSPFGLEGTVTTGVVSRVTKTIIQTDAAANPGNSGGPAMDKTGRIVGVLVAGVLNGQNTNFIVPIARACVVLRHC